MIFPDLLHILNSMFSEQNHISFNHIHHEELKKNQKHLCVPHLLSKLFFLGRISHSPHSNNCSEFTQSHNG